MNNLKDLAFLEVRGGFQPRENKIAWLLNYGKRFRTMTIIRKDTYDHTEFKYQYAGDEALKHRGEISLRIVNGKIWRYDYYSLDCEDLNHFLDVESFIDFLVAQAIV